MQNQQQRPSALSRLKVGVECGFDLHALLLNTSSTLSNLDFEHQHEIRKIEQSRTEPALKRQIMETLKRRHRERRQPYVMLVAELREHLSSAPAADRQLAG